MVAEVATSNNSKYIGLPNKEGLFSGVAGMMPWVGLFVVATRSAGIFLLTEYFLLLKGQRDLHESMFFVFFFVSHIN